MAARDADVVVIGHKEKYLRGRTTDQLESLLRVGAARVGVSDLPAYPTELQSLHALLGMAQAGDVVGLMCHAERQQVYDWLAEEGAKPDSPDQLREKVVGAAADEGRSA
jgi:cyanophycin synthetase